MPLTGWDNMNIVLVRMGVKGFLLRLGCGEATPDWQEDIPLSSRNFAQRNIRDRHGSADNGPGSRSAEFILGQAKRDPRASLGRDDEEASWFETHRGVYPRACEARPEGRAPHHEDVRRWLWVPAFAGTTLCMSQLPRQVPDFAGRC